MQRLTVRRLTAQSLAAILAACFTLVCAVGHAQPISFSTTPPAPGATVQPIAVPDILARADEDQQRVDRAKRLLEAADPIASLRASLDAIARPVDTKLRNTAGVALRELPVMRLESLARHWQFDARRFERWEADARRNLAPYADSAVQLAQRRAAWSATRAEGLLDGLPAVLAEHVDGVLGGIDASEAALSVALARQFELMQRASELKARIQAGAVDVAAAIADIDRRLLQNDAPPLWQGLGAGIGMQGALARMDRGLDIERQFAIDYSAATTASRRALQVLQILLLPIIVWLAWRSRRAERAGHTDHTDHADQADQADQATGTESQAVTRALRRPVSVWLLLSLLAVLVFEADAPLLVQEFVLLLALVPALRLLPAGLLRALGVWPYVAVLLYALDRLGVAVPADEGAYRLFLLVLNGLALGLTVWLLRRFSRAPALQAGVGVGLRNVVRATGWAVLCMLTIAAVANIWGNVSLAETLTSGVIDSGYMALLLYAGVTACLGLLRVLLGQPELTNRRLLREHTVLLQTAGERLLMLGACIGWLLYSMDRFRVLRPLYDASASVLGFGIDVGEVSIHLGDVLIFAFSAWLALWVARAVRRLLRDELPSLAGLPRGAGNSIASLSYYAVLVLGLLIALSAAGFKVSQLTIVLGALGVGIGFGLQNVVNNFVSGLVLMFERPIQPGDVVDLAGISGNVREIGLRATIIRTFDGADVVVPNGLLLSGNLTNWTMYDRSRRIEVPVGVAYGSDAKQVLAVLTAVAQATPGVADKPSPMVVMTGFGDSELNFAVRVWTHDINDWVALRSELLARMLAALQAAGISIPYKQLDVNLRNMVQPTEASAFAAPSH